MRKVLLVTRTRYRRLVCTYALAVNKSFYGFDANAYIFDEAVGQEIVSRFKGQQFYFCFYSCFYFRFAF